MAFKKEGKIAERRILKLTLGIYLNERLESEAIRSAEALKSTDLSQKEGRGLDGVKSKSRYRE